MARTGKISARADEDVQGGRHESGRLPGAHAGPDAPLDSSLPVNHTGFSGNAGGFPGSISVFLFLASTVFYGALGKKFSVV